jgi:two-component system, NtrC family, nitrogen regulation sensor histidine kinase NtrY
VSGLRFDRRFFLYLLAAALPGTAIALWVIWTGATTLAARVALSLLLLGVWLGCVRAAHSAVRRPLQTLANLLAALRQEDYSIEGRGADRDDPLGLVFHEANELRRLLRERRLGAMEATALLRTVMAEIDVAIFAFDAAGELRLVNRAGERLLRQPAPRLIGRPAGEIGLSFALEGDTPRTVDAEFPGVTGRWEIRRGAFRQGGEPHTLVVLADLSRALREEERAAWQRLIRVLSHEINNSLSPIHSIAETLLKLLARRGAADGVRAELGEGLTIVARRAEALRRFMTSYARLAHLPPPEHRPIAVRALLERVVGLEPDAPITLLAGPELVLHGDPDQLEQVLINLTRNAVEAAAETGGGIEVGWSRRGEQVEIRVDDEGPGLDSQANLFVPFFTTKQHGTGIGLALSRQIAEAHGGALTLENRTDRSGCRATLTLPL